jgi:hypothetical protein
MYSSGAVSNPGTQIIAASRTRTRAKFPKVTTWRQREEAMQGITAAFSSYTHFFLRSIIIVDKQNTILFRAVIHLYYCYYCTDSNEVPKSDDLAAEKAENATQNGGV